MKTSFSFLLALSFLSLVFTAPITSPTPTDELISRDINSFLALIGSLFPFSGLIQDVAGLLVAAQDALALLTGTPTSENDLSGSCKAVTVIWARGTTEPGNVGVLVGPPFFDALKSRIGSNNVAVQGVPYPADVEGFLEGGSPGAGNMMANLVQQAYSQCPNTKVVISGYSQGGQVVHTATGLLPASTMSQVSSVLVFGDPENGQSFSNIPASRTKVICHLGDAICLHTDLVLPAHLTYAENAYDAANFVASQAGY